MPYKIEAIDNDCYEGTTCLINKMDIKDGAVLNKVEEDIVFAKTTELVTKPIVNDFDFEYYKAIHKYLFEELYDWAGTIRKINISKKGTNFVDYKDVESVSQKIFEDLKSKNYFKDFDKDTFIDSMTDFYTTTNLLHPFREGNGRTQRVFISQLIEYCGYDFSFADIDSDDLMIATIQSANGVTTFLHKLFEENIH